MTLSIITPTSHNLCCNDPLTCDVGKFFPSVHYFIFIRFEFCLSFYYLIAQSHNVLLQGFTATAHLYYVINLATFANFHTLLITPWFRPVIFKINIRGLSTAPCRTALVPFVAGAGHVFQLCVFYLFSK